MATIALFENVCAPAVQSGDDATVSGRILYDGKPLPNATVTVTVTAPAGAASTTITPLADTTDERGKFSVTFAAATLTAESYSVGCVATYTDPITNQDAHSTYELPLTLKVYDTPSTNSCDPCTDLITAAKRVLRDPKVNRGVSQLLLGVANGESDVAGLQQVALTSLAKAVSGRDAVRAKGDSCRGQLRLFFEIEDPVTGNRTPLDSSLLPGIAPQLVDNNFNIANYAPTYDGTSILFSDVEAGPINVALASFIAEGVEILPDYTVKAFGAQEWTYFTKVVPSQGQGGSTTQPSSPTDLGGTIAVGNQPPPQTKSEKDSQGFGHEVGEVLSAMGRKAEELLEPNKKKQSGAPAKPADPTTAPGTPPPPAASAGAGAASSGGKPVGTKKNPGTTPTYQTTISGGGEIWMTIGLRPPAARVRCFAFMEGDDCCGQGKQYISRVAISTTQGDDFIQCRQTGDSGCSGFNLNPGWYNFSAPLEITIGGCNYILSSSSPIAAFLGAGQSCSDIDFSYKKKGCEIQVISEISSALGGDPYKQAKMNFPGMQYLLVREDDTSFAQAQKTTTGGAVHFRDLSAGTYWLFCQAPDLYQSQPVTPVSPVDGRLTLRVFNGQTSRVPVLVKFKTTTTTPAVLDGYVRDDTGTPVPQQLVQILNKANLVVAAGLTDADGLYSIQIYKAEELTIVVGTQQIAVTKSQVQLAMQSVGTPALPSPSSTLGLAMQTSELAGFN